MSLWGPLTNKVSAEPHMGGDVKGRAGEGRDQRQLPVLSSSAWEQSPDVCDLELGSGGSERKRGPVVGHLRDKASTAPQCWWAHERAARGT